MAVLTLTAMGIWYICTGGSQTTASLKWLQFMQTIGTFLLPALLGAWLWDERRRPFRWLRMEQGVEGQQFVLAVLLMVCAIPAINLLADLNSRIQLPESLDFIEQIFKQQEEAAALLTERFLKADTVSGLLVNIGLMALLPAIAEEVSFRGTLLQIIRGEQSAKSDYRVHWAIWITAFIFSAIHMQFYGFIPRILMGAMFGYIFVWTGSLWVPILMHFTNNGIAVLVYYLMGESMDGKSYADTFGAGTTWWVGVLSLLITSLGLLIFYRRTHTR
jgi:hypothetical protein